MSIDIRIMRNFITVASTSSISGAADLLHLAQPALSLQMKNLEQSLGVQLLERTTRGVRLTESGQRFLDHAMHLVRQFEIACDDIREDAKSPRGSVVIGLPQSIAKQIVLPLVKDASVRYPHIQLGITELSTGYIPANILKGHLDLGFVFQRDENPALRFEHIVDERLVIIGAASLFARSGKTNRTLPELSVAELVATHSLVVPAKAHGLRALIDYYLAPELQALRILAEVNSIPQLVELVEAGLGCAILSHASVVSEIASGRLSAAKIKGLKMRRPVYIVSSNGRPISAATAVIHQMLHGLTRTLVNNKRWPATLVSPMKNG